MNATEANKMAVPANSPRSGRLWFRNTVSKRWKKKKYSGPLVSSSFIRVIFFFKAYTIGSRHSSERHKPLEESGAGPSQGLPQSYENRKPVLTLSFDRAKTKLFCQLWWYKAILLTTTKTGYLSYVIWRFILLFTYTALFTGFIFEREKR